MSNKEKVTEQTEEKVMTKYDLKMQKRKEEKEKVKKQQRKEKLIWAVVIVALVCLVASFPIRSYMEKNETFVTINGEEISKLEFDYNYYVVKNNYLTQYGSYLSYFGLDMSADLESQMFSETMTWADYFEQEAVNSIIRGKALKAEAEAAGFTFDTSEGYENFKEGVKEQAKANEMSKSSYLEQAYGPYATVSNLKSLIEESLYVNAFYTQMTEEKTPSDEEVQAYYEADTTAFDSVDYYLTLVEAEIPTEPTDLADEETTTNEAGEYQASEAEIEKAMADAKEIADAAEATITTDGELKEHMQYSGTSYLIRDWLYDEARVEGDTTIIEDNTGYQYYVLSFVKRYLDNAPAADVRIIMKEDADGQAVLDEWKSGEATEESFAALADKYNEGTTFTAEGGLYEGVTSSGTLDIIANWLFDESRVAGDTTSVTSEDGSASYIMYYVGANEPEWKVTARNEILAEVMETYLQEISEGYEVEDPKGNLEYIAILAAEEAAAAAAETESAETEE